MREIGRKKEGLVNDTVFFCYNPKTFWNVIHLLLLRTNFRIRTVRHQLPDESKANEEQSQAEMTCLLTCTYVYIFHKKILKIPAVCLNHKKKHNTHTARIGNFILST